MTSRSFHFRSVVAPIVRFAPAILAVIALSVVQPTRAIADDEDTGWTKSVQTFTFETYVTNGCNDSDNVHILGELLVSVKTRLNNDGSVDTKETDHANGEGTGTSGSQYTFDEIGHVNESFGPNPDGTPFSYSERRKSTLKGVGGVPDQRVTFTILLIIDGSGNVTTDIFDFKLECN
jgi:hypothetical protein